MIHFIDNILLKNMFDLQYKNVLLTLGEVTGSWCKGILSYCEVVLSLKCLLFFFSGKAGGTDNVTKFSPCE